MVTGIWMFHRYWRLELELLVLGTKRAFLSRQKFIPEITSCRARPHLQFTSLVNVEGVVLGIVARVWRPLLTFRWLPETRNEGGSFSMLYGNAGKIHFWSGQCVGVEGIIIMNYEESVGFTTLSIRWGNRFFWVLYQPRPCRECWELSSGKVRYILPCT